MTDYYDGPRSGIANYGGVPHVYESLFWDMQGVPDVFLLQPLDDETFQLAMEDWTIWCRWERAFHSGQTTIDTHPALPADRARHNELASILEPRLRIQPEKAQRLRGTFDILRKPADSARAPTTSAHWVVAWMPDENAAFSNDRSIPPSSHAP